MTESESHKSKLRSAILATISRIPRGVVCSYGGIAKMTGYPNHARYVGATLRQLPKGSGIPWHRVVTASGHIAFPTGTDRFEEQLRRLTAEGIEVKDGRVSRTDFYFA